MAVINIIPEVSTPVIGWKKKSAGDYYAEDDDSYPENAATRPIINSLTDSLANR